MNIAGSGFLSAALQQGFASHILLRGYRFSAHATSDLQRTNYSPIGPVGLDQSKCANRMKNSKIIFPNGNRENAYIFRVPAWTPPFPTRFPAPDPDRNSCILHRQLINTHVLLGID